MVLSIEFKFRMYITGHRRTKPVDFGEYQMNCFFTGIQKRNSYALQPMESNYKKYASVYTWLSTKLKFDMCIVDHCSLNYINFGVSRM